MPIQMQKEANDLYVFRVSDMMKQSEFAAYQEAIGRDIDLGKKPRLLAVFENFGGWERGVDWNDLNFLITYGDKIARIALVAEPEWEARALAFAGAGMRQAPVRFFKPNELAEARTWIAE